VFPRARVHWISPRVQLGTSLRAAGQYQVADNFHRGTLALLKELGRERTANALLLYNSWAIVRSDMGDMLGAAQLFESGLGIGHALWGDGTPDQWASVTYGRRLVFLNRLDEAHAYFSSALRTSSGEDDAEMEAGALIGLISVSREKGDLVEARAARARAQQFIEAYLPPEHTMRMSFLLESGLLDVADGSLDDGKAGLQQLLSQLEHANRRMPDQIVALAGLARCALQSGELDQANELAAKASALARKVSTAGQLSYWLGLGLLAQVDVEQALGHTARARELSVEALSQLTASVGVDHPLTRKAAALAR
jgi:tetratricopeptide (TPR) repeat protein